MDTGLSIYYCDHVGPPGGILDCQSYYCDHVGPPAILDCPSIIVIM